MIYISAFLSYESIFPLEGRLYYGKDIAHHSYRGTLRSQPWVWSATAEFRQHTQWRVQYWRRRVHALLGGRQAQSIIPWPAPTEHSSPSWLDLVEKPCFSRLPRPTRFEPFGGLFSCPEHTRFNRGIVKRYTAIEQVHTSDEVQALAAMRQVADIVSANQHTQTCDT